MWEFENVVCWKTFHGVWVFHRFSYLYIINYYKFLKYYAFNLQVHLGWQPGFKWTGHCDELDYCTLLSMLSNFNALVRILYQMNQTRVLTNMSIRTDTHSLPYTILTLCMLGIFSCFCCCLLTFFKIIFFSKKYLRNTISVSNSLDPDEAWHIVRPHLGPNCLQRLSAKDKSCC